LAKQGEHAAEQQSDDPDQPAENVADKTKMIVISNLNPNKAKKHLFVDKWNFSLFSII